MGVQQFHILAFCILRCWDTRESCCDKQWKRETNNIYNKTWDVL